MVAPVLYVLGARAAAGRVPTDEHNLLKWCQDNGEYGQKVIAEWAEPDVNMKDMLPASNKKLLWRCPSGCMEDGQPFTWEARVSSRTEGRGCPGCAGLVPTDANNLRKWCEDNGGCGQKLVAEWAEPGVDMKDVMHASAKKMTWRCSAGCTVDGESFTWEVKVGAIAPVLIVAGARAVQVRCRRMQTTCASGVKTTRSTGRSSSRSGLSLM